MAIHCPADHHVFSVVLTNQKEASPKDKGLLRECQNRIPWFEASRELDQTLINILNLEQELGQKIDWVAAPFTFDELIAQTTNQPRYRSRMMLPKSTNRFCTEQLKLVPIFWHCFLNYYQDSPVLMSIGFRWDEPQRVENWSCDKDKFRYPFACSTLGTKRWQYKDIEWRISRFPLYEERITKQQVNEFWERKGWTFPIVSNCDFCFHHTDYQQRVQAIAYPERAQWWIEKEQQSGNTFGKRSLVDILSQGMLQIFNQPEEETSMCHCTD